MTREEAAIIIKECKDKGFKYTFYTLKEYHTALDMAIKALEQEPCEDAISRRAVIDIIHHYKNDRDSQLSDLTDGVCNLPSVQPEQKTGHWIWQTEDIYRCSECGEDIHVKEVMNVPQYVLCPICGTRMAPQKD